ncbi:MAG: hypothetical protein ISS70_09525 [Phycisphaerae bacterium]|nr:hypothetical protein [Phycisphaerae bacterium]
MEDKSVIEKNQARRPIWPGGSDQERFFAILNNRGKSETSEYLPVRRNGFVVLVRGAKDLRTLQALCLDPSQQDRNTCLTVRYRVRPGAIFGTLIAALITDLQKIQQGKCDESHPIEAFGPEPDDSRWERMLKGPLESVIAKWPDGKQGAFSSEFLEKWLGTSQLEEFLSSHFSDESTLPKGSRFVLFGEVSEVSEDSSEWQEAIATLFPRLPERIGFVLSGVPDHITLPRDDPHFLEIELPQSSDDGSDAGSRVSKYTHAPLLSDRPAQEDQLGVYKSAEALARFILHEQTKPPLTVGIHGPWGKGKSSFMELVDIAMVKWASANRESRTVELERLLGDIKKIEGRIEGAKAGDQAGLQHELDREVNRHLQLWQAMQRAARKDVLTVRFNAWQFEDATQIWAGLASAISRRLENALHWSSRIGIHVQYAWTKHRTELLLNLLLPILFVVPLGIYSTLRGGEHLKAFFADWKHIEAFTDALLPLGSTLFLMWIVINRILKVVQPVSDRVLSYTQLPKYCDQMGYQHQVLDDLRFVYKYLQDRWAKCKVVVFIDDLDRCSEEKIMEVLQAINLILAGSDFFVFLGIDTEMIYRAIETHYSSKENHNSLPADLPESYLRKILQLSFHLPVTHPEKRFKYLSRLFSRKTQLELNLNTNSGSEHNHQDEDYDPAKLESGVLRYDLQLLQQVTRQQLQEDVVDTLDELRAFQDHQRFLEDNPREIKRLVNVHRLVKILLQKNTPWTGDRQRKLVKWLIFCAHWPDLIDDVLVVREEKSHPNCLEELSTKLKRTEGNQATLDLLREFALHQDTLSSDDIDDDFVRAATISQMVRDPMNPKTQTSTPDFNTADNAKSRRTSTKKAKRQT